MKAPKISSRAAHTPASAIRKLVPLADNAKKRGISVYHVNIGQPDLPTPKEILSSISNFHEPTLEYAPSTGLAVVQDAWKSFYNSKGYGLTSQDIIVTSGGSEGLVFAFLTVADPGDEIIVFEPFYTSYAIMAAMGNVKFRPVKTRVEDGYHLPPKAVIEKSINKKTRAIIVCNPNNPTGTLYTPQEVKILASIALEHNLFLISDETYQEIVFDGKKVLPFVSFKDLLQKLIIVDSVSKRFNACGARVGCVASKNGQVMQAILRFAQSRLSVATVEQLSVVGLLKNYRTYVSGIRSEYENRRNAVVSALHKIDGVTFVPPEGAFYIMPKIPVKNSDDFAAYLLNDFEDRKETVMVAPATGFYVTPGLGKNEIRIAYVLNEKKIARAMELLGLALDRFKG